MKINWRLQYLIEEEGKDVDNILLKHDEFFAGCENDKERQDLENSYTALKRARYYLDVAANELISCSQCGKKGARSYTYVGVGNRTKVICNVCEERIKKELGFEEA